MSADAGFVYTSATGFSITRRDDVRDLLDGLHVRAGVDGVSGGAPIALRANSVATIPGITSVTCMFGILRAKLDAEIGGQRVERRLGRVVRRAMRGHRHAAEKGRDVDELSVCRAR